ncbi:MAG: TetR/AcrR family transcriptional regulator [Desulfovibrio sp.]|jgi:AcrR family transcriptional regulator|nr:TetR/AcrR family transcriptional regulator [Desulfovibrio sp.]
MAPAEKNELDEKKQCEHRPRNAAETKKRILEAAGILFSKDVYRNVGTRDIAAAAGVNLTLINRYFGSKKKLFMEVVRSLGGEVSSPGMAKELAFEVIMDFLSEEENPRKREGRMILLSSMDSEVSGVISDFFSQRLKLQDKFIQGDHKKTKAALAFSSIFGIAIASFLFHESDRKLLDKAYIIEHFSELFDKLYSGGEDAIRPDAR